MSVPRSAVLKNPISPTRFSTFPEVLRFRILVADDYLDILMALRLGEEYGEQRLLHLLIEKRRLGATALQEAVVDSVKHFSGGGLKDDSTVVVGCDPVITGSGDS